MSIKQGDLALLNDPIAQELLHSTIPARLGYVWNDGTPRVIAIWFHWNGQEIVMVSPLKAPKVEVLPKNSNVSIVIDTNTWPYRELSIRGKANVEIIEGVVPEYAAAARRYFGEEQGAAWETQIGAMFTHMARISVRPEWVGLLDFEQRFPSAIAAAMNAQ